MHIFTKRNAHSGIFWQSIRGYAASRADNEIEGDMINVYKIGSGRPLFALPDGKFFGAFSVRIKLALQSNEATNVEDK